MDKSYEEAAEEFGMEWDKIKEWKDGIHLEATYIETDTRNTGHKSEGGMGDGQKTNEATRKGESHDRS